MVAIEHLPPTMLPRIEERLKNWFAGRLEGLLLPLVSLQKAVNMSGGDDPEQLAAGGRGIGFRLVENFGAISRAMIANDVRELAQEERGKLRKLGVRFGEFTIFMPNLLKPASAKLLTLLFEVTELFDMQTRPELIMLQKTMVVVEGVARTLDPRFNMWKAAEPVVGSWIRDNLGPKRLLVDFRDGLEAAVRLGEQLPQLAARSEKLAEEVGTMAEHGLRFDAATAEAIGRAEARHSRSGRIALWVIALALVAIAIRLY